MNIKFNFLAILMALCVIEVTAQSKLLIEITSNTNPDFILKVDGKILSVAEGTEISIPTTQWDLTITNKNTKKFTLRIVNTEENSDTLKISDFSKTYKVNGGRVDETNFTFDKNINLILMNGKTEVLKKTFKYSGSRTPPDPSAKATGSAVYDAYYIKYGSKDATRLAILSYYAKCNATATDVSTAYKDNKFLKAEVQRVDAAFSHSKNKKNPVLASALASVGGLDVTNIADGLARFLVKRTKEELNIAFFQDFRDFLTDEKHKDLQTVFPETYRTLIIIGDEIYNFERYIQTLRESFRSDLANLTTNLPSIIDNHRLFFEQNPELKATLLSSIYLAEGLRDKVHPGDIINEYPTEYLDSLSPLLKGSVKTLQLFSESLRDSTQSDNSKYWVSSQDLKKLVKDTAVFRIYIGLTYQLAKSKYNDIPLAGDTTLVKIMDLAGPGKLQAYQNYVFRFIGKTDKLVKMIETYSKPANDSIALEQYYNYFKSSVDLLEYSTQVTTLPFMPVTWAKAKDKTKDYFLVANTTADLVLDINRKNYASAVRNAVSIYDIIKVKRSKNFVDTLNNLINKTLPQKIAATVDLPTKATLQNQLNAAKDELILEKESGTVMKKMFTYGSFMSEIATAKSPEQVEATIEAFALPTGSARIKRETSFNVALNGYLGAYYGWERIRGLETKASGVYGLTAPIGISISRGHSIFFLGTGETGWKKGKKGWSTSLFISLIDIGAIASFRFTTESNTEIVAKDTTTTTIYQLPKIELKDIISPGAFISLGIPKTPLSINMGAQIGPNLRKVSVSSTDNTVVNDYSDNMYWRFSLSLVVDIPILNFYTKPRK